jgi:hypothetical protein
MEDTDMQSSAHIGAKKWIPVSGEDPNRVLHCDPYPAGTRMG